MLQNLSQGLLSLNFASTQLLVQLQFNFDRLRSQKNRSLFHFARHYLKGSSKWPMNLWVNTQYPGYIESAEQHSCQFKLFFDPRNLNFGFFYFGNLSLVQMKKFKYQEFANFKPKLL